MSILKTLARALASVVVAMALVGSTALAQSSDTGTITVEVLRYECTPPAPLAVKAEFSSGSAFSFAQYDTESSGSLTVLIQVDNAACDQWSVTAELDDFELSTDSSTTFPASTFVLTHSSSNPPAGTQRWIPAGWDPLPSGVQDNVGLPTAPQTVTFAGSPIATGSGPILSADSTSAYGSPGSSAVFYDASLSGLPSDIEPGTYTSELRVTVQGDD